MPLSWAKAFRPTMALLYWTGNAVTRETSLDARVSMVVSMPVKNGMTSPRVLMAMTISSSAALPARSPSPLTAHSTWRGGGGGGAGGGGGGAATREGGGCEE